MRNYSVTQIIGEFFNHFVEYSIISPVYPATCILLLGE